MKLKDILKLDPTKLLVLILGLLSLGAIIANDWETQIFIHLAATLGFGLILFKTFSLISKQTKNIWNTIISCLIIFLILHYGIKNTDVIYALTATFITIFFKFFLEYKSAPIINPVILGLLLIIVASKIISGIESPFISWWGASYKIAHIPVALIFIALWIIFGLNKWRKLGIFFSYLITYALLLLIFYKDPLTVANFSALKFIFTDSTIYFFTAIMLIEPKTSPFTKIQQIIYGMIAAIVSIIYLLFNITTFDLLAIAIPNLYFFITKSIKIRTSSTPLN